MHDSKSEWLTSAKTAPAMDGQHSVIDKKEGSFIIEWKKADGRSRHKINRQYLLALDYKAENSKILQTAIETGSLAREFSS